MISCKAVPKILYGNSGKLVSFSKILYGNSGELVSFSKSSLVQINSKLNPKPYDYLYLIQVPRYANYVCSENSNPFQSSPSLTTLVPLWFIIISLALFHLSKLLFSVFLQFKGNFVGGQNNS